MITLPVTEHIEPPPTGRAILDARQMIADLLAQCEPEFLRPDMMPCEVEAAQRRVIRQLMYRMAM